MANFKVKYLKEYRDRQGRFRRYFNRPGSRQIPLLGVVGSAEFNQAYAAALSGMAVPPTVATSIRHTTGTFNDLVNTYYGSAAYQSLAAITKSNYRNVIEKFRAGFGHCLIAELKREDVHAIVDKKASTPGAANMLLRVIKMLMRFAVKRGLLTIDPTALIDKIRPTTDGGWHEWTEQEVAQYEERHPIGTRARLALDLLLCTAQRRGDVIRMGPADVRNGYLHVTQGKTKVRLELPILEPLQASLAATTTGKVAFLETSAGKPFSNGGFGVWFYDRCKEAGLVGCSAHGLRKVACRRLAEAGATDQEMMGWTGHVTRAELTRYSRGASQKIGAKAGAAKLKLSNGANKSSNEG